MKLSAAILVGVEASHFRAVSYDVIQGGPGQLQISRTMAWRQSFSGYPGVCTSAHVANQTPSGSMGVEGCSLTSGGSCGAHSSTYIVTDIEDQLSTANNFCYGYNTQSFTKPSGPFSMSWGGQCWVTMTGDDGLSAGGCGFGFIAKVNDLDNNSPQVKIPPIWKIMAGCPGQTLALSPVDLDNDLIKCRWATSFEAQGAVHSDDFASLSLDEDTCVVTYDGTKDLSTEGVKPIAIQVEDYDSDGNIRSSMPVQFLATVWTPSNSNFNNRFLSLHGPGSVVQMPDFFPEDDHEDEVGRRRRDTGVPSYCSAVPTLIDPSPAAGAVIANDGSTTNTIIVKATSNNGAITRFMFNSPMGMTCTNVNGNGESSCTFTPSAEQQNQALNFCFQAEDGAGMTTERRCVTIAVGVEVETMGAEAIEVTEIFTLIQHAIPDMEGDFEGYGCAGVGNMDASLKTIGRAVDDVDAALRDRKHCINCAQRDIGQGYTSYEFDEDDNTCADNRGTAERAFCECDLAFVNAVDGASTDNKNYDTDQCLANVYDGTGNGKCCKSPKGYYNRYNSVHFQCCSGKIVEIGSC